MPENCVQICHVNVMISHFTLSLRNHRLESHYERQVPTYLKEWERRNEIVAQVAALEEEALRARMPVPHEYEIRPER